MGAVTIITCVYFWIGILIASAYKPPEPENADLIDRFVIAVLWLPLAIAGSTIDD